MQNLLVLQGDEFESEVVSRRLTVPNNLEMYPTAALPHWEFLDVLFPKPVRQYFELLIAPRRPWRRNSDLDRSLIRHLRPWVENVFLLSRHLIAFLVWGNRELDSCM